VSKPAQSPLSPSFRGFFLPECCFTSWPSARDWSSLSLNWPWLSRRW